MSKIAIVVEQSSNPGKFEEHLAKMCAHAQASRQEPGCLRFDVVVPKKGENKLFLYEMWADPASLDVHANSERMKAHRASTKELVADSKITLCDLRDSADL